MTAYHCDPPEALLREWWRKRSEQEGLPERWQKIATLRADGMTQKAIAAEMGVSQVRVWQLLKKIARRST